MTKVQMLPRTKEYTFAFDLHKLRVPDFLMDWGAEPTKKEQETIPYCRAEILQAKLKLSAYPQRCSFVNNVRRVVVIAEHRAMATWLDRLGAKYPEFLEEVREL